MLLNSGKASNPEIVEVEMTFQSGEDVFDGLSLILQLPIQFRASLD